MAGGFQRSSGRSTPARRRGRRAGAAARRAPAAAWSCRRRWLRAPRASALVDAHAHAGERRPLAVASPSSRSSSMAGIGGSLWTRCSLGGVSRLVGINHVALEVGDLDAALEFYGAVFDFELRGRVPGMAFLDMGDQFLAIAATGKSAADGERHFGLVVDDMEEARGPGGGRGGTSSAGAALTSAIPGATTCRWSSTARFSSRRRRERCAAWDWRGSRRPLRRWRSCAGRGSARRAPRPERLLRLGTEM